MVCIASVSALVYAGDHTKHCCVYVVCFVERAIKKSEW